MQDNQIKNTQDKDIAEQKKKLKRIIIIVFSVCLLFAVAYFFILNIPEKRVQSTDYADALTDYEFYPKDTGNIFADPDYTEDMRRISYTYFEGEYEISEELFSSERAEALGEEVKFMYDYINYIISGNTAGYNNCFSSAYYEKVYPKESFTMQRLYDISLIKVTERYEEGMLVYVFKLSYKILKNDGTFRKDISSTSSRTKTIYLTTRDGRLAIDGEIIYHIEHDIQ